MGYALLWIENLTVSLLLLATVLACVGHLQWRWLRCAIWTVMVLAFTVFYGNLVWLTGLFQFRTGFVATWFYPALSLAVIVLLGMVWLSIVGFRRADGMAVPIAAGTWPRGKLALALGAALALHAMTFWNLDLAARQQLDALRTEAGAVAASVTPPRIPDRDNAAIVYERAFEGFPPKKSWDGVLQEKWDEWTGPDVDLKDPELRAFLKRHALTIGLLHEAANKPGCCFERDYGRPNYATALPEISQLREAAKLLALNARVKAADGDVRSALQDIKTMFVISQHVSTERPIICLLVSMTVEQLATDTLQEVLAGRKVSEDDLTQFDSLNRTPSYQRLLERCVRLEEAFVLSLSSDIGRGELGFADWAQELPDRNPALNCPALNVAYRVFLLSDDVMDQRRLSYQWRELASQPYCEARLQWKQFDDKLRDGPTGLLTSLLTPAMGCCAEQAAMADARRQAIRLALAMEQYRARHDQFPDQLDDLVPEIMPAVLRDPFDGKPMRMRYTDHRWIIYSIGPDMVDNEGAKYDKPHKTGDITFELSDAPQP